MALGRSGSGAQGPRTGTHGSAGIATSVLPWMALDQLQLEMLFKTGDSSLTPGGIDRLGLLAAFLEKNLDLDIVIAGFSDPRGNSAANLALSKARATAGGGSADVPWH